MDKQRDCSLTCPVCLWRHEYGIMCIWLISTLSFEPIEWRVCSFIVPCFVSIFDVLASRLRPKTNMSYCYRY